MLLNSSRGSGMPVRDYHLFIKKFTNTHTHKKEIKMTKTPYEVRLEVLKMAQDQANQKFYNEWNNAAEKARIQEDAQYLTEVPKFPTAEQILAEANKLKMFIDGG